MNFSFEKRDLIKKKLEKDLVEQEKSSVEEFKNFLFEKFNFLPGSTLKEKSSKELLDFYCSYLNQEPNFENFKEFYEKITKKKIGKKDYWRYKEYLLGKLPEKLQERQLEISEEKGESDEELVKRLEDIHKKREKESLRTILGFHTSDIDFWKGEGKTFIKSGPRVEVIKNKEKTGLKFYSVNPQSLFLPRSKFLYLVEGSIYDLKKGKHVHNNPNWVYVERELKVLKCIPLNNEVIKEFGLVFEKL